MDNGSLKRSCYRNIFNRDITLDCKSDRNQEFNKIQNSNFVIDQNINLLINQQSQDDNSNSTKILILEQSFDTFPTGSGSFIINNVNEHIAYFQASFKLENNIACSDQFENSDGNQNTQCSGIKLDGYTYQDPNGKIFKRNGGEVSTSNINDSKNEQQELWSVLDESNQIKSKLTYHQTYPFNTIQHLPANKNIWFKESIKKMKIGKTIPQQSFSPIGGKIISKWLIPNNLDFVLLNTTYIHSMGDMVLGGRHIEHNDYKLVDYGLYDIKKLNLNTNEIIPFKRKYF